MRITPELISGAEEILNPLGDREIVLRGLNIPTIENLGTLKDAFQTMDLSDNDVTHLAGFPLLKRLQNLIITRNSISSVLANLGRMLPNLKELVMTDNLLDSFNELDKLASLARLTVLVLVGNPVCTKHLYREFLIYKLPLLEVLDFRRVTLVEKREAKRIFETTPEGKKLVNSIGAGVLMKGERRKDDGDLNGDVVVSGGGGAKANGTNKSAMMTIEAEDELERKRFIREAILNAKTVEETNRLENALASGMSIKEIKAMMAPAKEVPPPTTTTNATTTASETGEALKVQHHEEETTKKSKKAASDATTTTTSQTTSVKAELPPNDAKETTSTASTKPAEPANVEEEVNHQQQQQQDYGSLKVTELKDELKRRKLSAAGNKAELVARLKADDEAASKSEDGSGDAPPPKRQKV